MCGFLQSPSVLFPLGSCVALINLSRQYKYMLSPISLSSESLNARIVLETQIPK